MAFVELIGRISRGFSVSITVSMAKDFKCLLVTHLSNNPRMAQGINRV